MKNKIKNILTNKFNYSGFRSGQEEAILSVLEENNTLVMLPTGIGKSLCYQLPSYYYDEGLTIIISPLLSLMQDQVENLQQSGEMSVAALNSMTTSYERNRILNNLNYYRFLYTSPEMLQNDRIIRELQKVKINLFVVDEAHCISHWGTDFRPDYLSLRNIREKLNNPTTMALTATATQEVRDEINNFLGLKDNETNQIVKSVDREEIKLVVEDCKNQDKDSVLLNYIHQLDGPGIIYFMSKNLADEWAEKLFKEYQIKSVSYHSDIETDDKIKIQQQFLTNQIQIVCATSAFGMGFNKSDIRFIIHYHLPATPEMYLQEIGRASRDGKESIAVLLYQPGDEQIQNYFIQNSLPSNFELEQVYNHKIKSYSKDDKEPLYKLARYFIENSSNLEEAVELVNDRKKIKEKQLLYMLEYIHTKACKREYLLKYFNEEDSKLMSNCCSSCGINKEILIEQLNAEINDKIYKEKHVNLLSWKEVFKKLYKQ